MAIKIRRKTSEKKKIRHKNKKRIRSAVSGSAERPRLAVFRSNAHLYAQIVDDVKGTTLAAASSRDEEFGSKKAAANIANAKEVGLLVAKRAIAKNIAKVVFDRGGFVYHGRIKAIADGAREGGLKF